MHGFDDGTFRPPARTRRDHVASFMSWLLYLLAGPVEVGITDFTFTAEAPGPVTVTASIL